MRDRPGMSNLRENCPAFGVHDRGDGPPALDLAFGKEAWSVDESDCLRADPGAFGEDEASRRPLAIVFDMKLCGRKLAIARATARHSRHHHTVFELKFAERVGSEEKRLVRSGHG